MRDDRLYLRHILDALGKIASYTQDGREAFRNNPMAQDAVIRNFEIIGEATKQIGMEAKSREPAIPWRSVSGFRDVLIHNYMGVDLDEVWNVVQNHLPALRDAARRLLAERT